MFSCGFAASVWFRDLLDFLGPTTCDVCGTKVDNRDHGKEKKK